MIGRYLHFKKPPFDVPRKLDFLKTSHPWAQSIPAWITWLRKTWPISAQNAVASLHGWGVGHPTDWVVSCVFCRVRVRPSAASIPIQLLFSTKWEDDPKRRLDLLGCSNNLSQLEVVIWQFFSGLWRSARTTAMKWSSRFVKGILHEICVAGWWFGTFCIFPYIGNVTIPIDVIFFRGVAQPPTRW